MNIVCGFRVFTLVLIDATPKSAGTTGGACYIYLRQQSHIFEPCFSSPNCPAEMTFPSSSFDHLDNDVSRISVISPEIADLLSKLLHPFHVMAYQTDVHP